MHTNAFSVTIGEVPPEPTIGPGMILEKGRTRLVLIGYDAQHEMYGCIRWRREMFSREWKQVNDGMTSILHTVDNIRRLLASGFRVVKPAAAEGDKP